jgi:hypothetical protein
MKFWKDSGNWNDMLVQGSIVVAMAAGGAFGYWLWGTRGVVLALAGIPIGFVSGFGLVAFLCTYCSVQDDPGPDEQN